MSNEGVSDKPSVTLIWRNGVIATVVATVINAVLYLAGSTFTFPAEAVSPFGDPITLVPVVLATVFGGVAATIGYTVLTRLLSLQLANRIMWIGIILVLIGMTPGPFGIENVSIAQVIIMQVMHFVAAIPVVMLTRSSAS